MDFYVALNKPRISRIAQMNDQLISFPSEHRDRLKKCSVERIGQSRKPENQDNRGQVLRIAGNQGARRICISNNEQGTSNVEV